MGAKKKKVCRDNFRNASISGGMVETIDRFGSANKEHLVAYSGIDNEHSKVLKKGLKRTANSKVNSKYKFKNEHQQAGFSAEDKTVARANAEAIIEKRTERMVRTDDIGRVNDPLYDTVIIDRDGNIVEGSGTQLKFVGAAEKDPLGKNTAKRVVKYLKNSKRDKYWENDVPVEIPSDQYKSVKDELLKQKNSIKRQLESKKISEETRAKKELQLKKLEKIESKLKKGRVSSAEAIEARRNPKLSTIKDINKLSHRAGLEGAKYGAAIGGIMSIINNTVAVCRGEKNMSEAIKHVALDTGVSGGVGYISTYTGAAIKGVMQNSSNAYIRTISNTGLPGVMVSATLASGKVLNRYLKGEIDGVQCLQELGQENMNMISSSLYAVIGQALIPIPVVGGIVGGMMGYALSSATFSLLKNALEEEKLAKENRILVEKACAEHIQKMEYHKKYLEEIVNKYLTEEIDSFNKSFSGILDALDIGDTEWFVDCCNTITEQYGGNPLGETQEEFNKKMIEKDVFIL